MHTSRTNINVRLAYFYFCRADPCGAICTTWRICALYMLSMFSCHSLLLQWLASQFIGALLPPTVAFMSHCKQSCCFQITLPGEATRFARSLMILHEIPALICYIACPKYIAQTPKKDCWWKWCCHISSAG